MPPDPAGDLALLARLGLAPPAHRDPRDLSGGEQQRAALAAILVAEPEIILLDEPTRGLDYLQKRSLADFLLELKAEGRTVVMATHDVELAAACATGCSYGRRAGRGRWAAARSDERVAGIRIADQQVLPRSPLPGSR